MWVAFLALILGGTMGLGYSASRSVTANATVVSGPVFGHTVNLGNAGGEPSIHDDGKGHVFIDTPVGIGNVNSGVLFSRSLDGGQTFQPNISAGGVVGGGDTDVVTDVLGKGLYIDDLALTHANILKSTDLGATFGQAVPTGFVDDREWLTTVGPNVYLTFHDAANNAPEIYGSTDGGATWLPLGFAGTGQMLGPTDPAFLDNKCNTLVGKPVTDVNGTIYVVSNTTTFATNLQVGCALPPPSLERFYMLISSDGGHSFTSHLVSDLGTAATGNAKPGSWGHVFNQLAIDNGGNLYIDASGTLDGNLPLQNYLLVSKDGGRTFGHPIPTNPEPAHAQLFPSIAVGQAGQVAVGYYRGGLTDHHTNGNDFQFVIDQTFNALDPSPAFSHTTLTPLKGTTPHPDGICTDGIFCGTPASSGGNRNLADFESMTVDPAGHLEVIIPADCAGPTPQTTCTGTENWFYKQTSGLLMPPGPTNGSGTGNQTWVAGARTAPPPGPPAAVAVPTPALPNTAIGRPPLSTRLVSGLEDWVGVASLAVLLIAGVALYTRRLLARRR